MIRKGDKIGVLVYLHNGGDPNARNHMGWTLLHLACMEGQTSVVEVLLDSGASANSCTTDMSTPLHRACLHGYKSIAELLIKKSAYINAQDKAGNTPLHEAAKGFQTGVVRLLMEKKVDKTKTNRKNQGFLQLVGQQLMPTVETGDVEVLVEWLDWGLSPDTKGNLHWSILHHACARGHLNIVSLLIERGANVNAEDSNRTSPLHTACFYGHQRIVQLLLDSGANVNAQDGRGNTPLYSSIEGTHSTIINLLLDHGADTTLANMEGHLFTHLVNEFLVRAVHSFSVADVISLLRAHADPNSRDSYGFPVLSHAAFKGEVLVTEGLLEAGADSNITDPSGKTPLHHAAYWGHLFIVKALVDKAAKVNVTDKFGVTPLHEAAREGAEDVITVLTGRGAKLDAADSDGNTPLHYAGRWGQPATVDQLIEIKASDTIRNKIGLLYSDLALIRAVRTEDRGQVMAGLAWGGDPNSRDARGWTLLHHAVYKSAYEVCELLLECDGDVNAVDSHGRTPLLLAAYRGNHKIMELLLSHGSDVNKQDWTGQTALHWAASEGSTDTVQVLLDHNADTTIVSHTGLLYTDLLVKRLYLAVRHHDADQVGRLMRAGADQFAEVAGTELTPRQEAERQRHYPTIRQMSALAKKQPRPDQDKLIALEDVYRLFEDGYSTEDDDDGDDFTDSDDEDAYWKMSNAYEVLTVDEAFGNEEQAWLAEFEEKQPVISVKELCQEDQEAFWQSWEDTPTRPVPASEFFREETDWWVQDDKEEQQQEEEEKEVISAKEFFTEDECWWRDAVEDLNKPKVVPAREFFKEQEAWWELEQTQEEEEEEEKEKEKGKSTKEYWKNIDKPWWETEGDQKPNVISVKQFFQEDEQPWWEARSEEEPKVISAKQLFQDEERPWWDTTDEVEPKVLSAREFIDDDKPWWQIEESPLEKPESPPPIKLKKSTGDVDAPLYDSLTNGEDENEKINQEEGEEEEEEGVENESSLSSEVSTDEEVEEWSRTEDYEDANDSIQSDTSTMYSASEGDKFTLQEAPRCWNVEGVDFGMSENRKGDLGLGARKGNWEETLYSSETKGKVHGGETFEINIGERKLGHGVLFGRGEKEREEDLSEVSEATETFDFDTSEVSEAVTVSWDEDAQRTCDLYLEEEEEKESEEEEAQENEREGKMSEGACTQQVSDETIDNRIHKIEEEEEEKTGSEIQQEQEVNTTSEEDKGIGEESNSESEDIQSEDEIADISEEEEEETDIKEEIEEDTADETPVSLVNNSNKLTDEQEASNDHQTNVSSPHISIEKQGEEFVVEKGRNDENRRRRRRRIEEEDTGADDIPNRVSRMRHRRTNLAVGGTSMLLEPPQNCSYLEGNLQKSDSQTSGYESSLSESRPVDCHVDPIVTRESDVIKQISRPSEAEEMRARENVEGQESKETLHFRNDEKTETVKEEEIKNKTPVSNTEGGRIVIHMKLNTNSMGQEAETDWEADKIKSNERTNAGSVHESDEYNEDMTVQPSDIVREKLDKDCVRLCTSEESLSSTSSSSDSKSSRSAVNRMDDCLARVDASLALVDARLTRDSVRSRSHRLHRSPSERKRRTRAVQLQEKGAEMNPKYTTKKTMPVPATDEEGPAKDQDGLVLMKVHVRVSETDADGGRTSNNKGKFIPGTFVQGVVTNGGNTGRKGVRGAYSFPDTPLSKENIYTTHASTTIACTAHLTTTHPHLITTQPLSTHTGTVDSSILQPHSENSINKLHITDLASTTHTSLSPSTTHPSLSPSTTHPSQTPPTTHPSPTHPSPTPPTTHPSPTQPTTHPSQTPPITHPSPTTTHPSQTPPITHPSPTPSTTHPSPTHILDTPFIATLPASESVYDGTDESSLPEVTEEATIKLNKTGKINRVHLFPEQDRENVTCEHRDEEKMGSQVIEGTIVIAAQSYDKDGSSDEVQETTSEEVEETSEDIDEIADEVKDISEESSDRVEESNEDVEEEEGSERVEEISEDIEEIVEEVKEISENIEEGSESVEESSDVVEESSERVEESSEEVSERVEESNENVDCSEGTEGSSKGIEEINVECSKGIEGSSERIEEISKDLHVTSEEAEGNNSSTKDNNSEDLNDERRNAKVVVGVLEIAQDKLQEIEGDSAEKFGKKSRELSEDDILEEFMKKSNETPVGKCDREAEHSSEGNVNEETEKTCMKETIETGGNGVSTEDSKLMFEKWITDKSEQTSTVELKQNSGEPLRDTGNAKESEMVPIIASESEKMDSCEGLKDTSEEELEEPQQRVTDVTKKIFKREAMDETQEISANKFKEESSENSGENTVGEEEIMPEILTATTSTEGSIETPKRDIVENSGEVPAEEPEENMANSWTGTRLVEGEPLYTQTTKKECQERESTGKTLASEEISCETTSEKNSSTVVSRETSVERSSSAVVSRETSAEREMPPGEVSRESSIDSDSSRDIQHKLQSVRPREARWRLCSTYEPVSISEYDTLAHILSKSLSSSDAWMIGMASGRSPSMESITHTTVQDDAHTPAPDHKPARRCKHRSKVEAAGSGSEMAGRDTQDGTSTAESPYQRKGSLGSEKEGKGEQSPKPVPVSLPADTNTTRPPLTPRRRREHRVEDEGGTKEPTNSTLLYDPDNTEAGLVEQATPALEKVVVQPTASQDHRGEQQAVMRRRTDPAGKTTSCQTPTWCDAAAAVTLLYTSITTRLNGIKGDDRLRFFI
ncbi:hypothetical protein Pmani_000705 [Petrolisthes manimaculis]|uniref:Uncharacterized protein n=1 Tax=Petrolisthes manimaculis TaxID=1843537 RepID=A0AAE1UQ22_9EUCA|nr:hypothetical protein Pmani_000705 [Petrolisthes manimaculis]